jgi:hypothetical protein
VTAGHVIQIRGQKMSQETLRKNPVPETVEEKTDSTVSARTEQKQKSQRKTRSRVPRSEWKNSFSAGLQGSLTMQVARNAGAKPEGVLNELFRSVQGRFDVNDPVAAVLIDMFVADYGRLSVAFQHEQKIVAASNWPFNPQGYMPTVSRYINSTYRDLGSTLKELRQLEKEAAEAEDPEVEVENTSSGFCRIPR